jgi:BASS family bile acid:Na+ symporter
MVLIGSCSSGLASNVMAYMARANLALSVAVTAIGTLFAPVMTPLWMKLLASESVEVSFMSQMLTIIKIVIVPIGAALIHDYLKTSRGTHSSERGQGEGGRATSHGPRILLTLAILGIIWLAAMALGGWKFLSAQLPEGSMTALGMIGFFWAAIVAGVVYHQLTRIVPPIERVMPRLSMAGIIFFTAVTTAVGRDNLLAIGWLLLVAVVIHNLVGYTLGYWLSRAEGLDKNSARSVSLEVGIHNGGMAIGVASTMGKLASVGLAAAIFSPWMNISGSILANYWRTRPGDEQTI